MNFLRQLFRPLAVWLAKVTAVDIGKPNDSLLPLSSAGTALDKSWHDLSKEFSDALEAWRKNPIARRLISLTTAYVIGGDGIRLQSSYKSFDKFLKEFANHPQNQLLLRQQTWCDELARSGELFLILFLNDGDGMSYVRAMPASRIKSIEWKPGDYEAELSYQEVAEEPGGEGTVWYSPRAAQSQPKEGSAPKPVMLHYAVNRPVGAVRGESDLAPILPWLRRYSRWLEDRTRLNAAVRSFLWIIKVPGHLIKQKQEQYRQPPAPGSVIITEKDAEEWEAVTPNLNARDASADGRAIRWMIVAGGPGTALTDLGEGEDANLATATALGEQRRRFLRRRQAYFGWMLADLAVVAWNRAVAHGLERGRLITTAEVELMLPDISPGDNATLASAAAAMTGAMKDLQELLGPSEAFRRLVLRLVLKFAGESVSERDFEEIVTGGAFTEPAPPEPENNHDLHDLHESNGHHNDFDDERLET